MGVKVIIIILFILNFFRVRPHYLIYMHIIELIVINNNISISLLQFRLLEYLIIQ